MIPGVLLKVDQAQQPLSTSDRKPTNLASLGFRSRSSLASSAHHNHYFFKEPKPHIHQAFRLLAKRLHRLQFDNLPPTLTSFHNKNKSNRHKHVCKHLELSNAQPPRASRKRWRTRESNPVPLADPQDAKRTLYQMTLQAFCSRFGPQRHPTKAVLKKYQPKGV
ncbi:hypothetical protein O181_086486 [Austropuccinia psidii MF-1]|uniref:Uncharacterized protein n=1 Tax=Austropuccinia psidii MF-1 TaxID=1389203 RepID=A0A9Q3G028_9BASI|nr:hypothetical protein [Austropuccinia psidii MF-1]